GLAGHHERRDGGLHVRGSPSVEPALAHGGDERIGMPFAERAGRHYVGMSGEADQRLGVAPARPQVVDRAEAHGLAAKAGFGETRTQELLATPVFGSH